MRRSIPEIIAIMLFSSSRGQNQVKKDLHDLIIPRHIRDITERHIAMILVIITGIYWLIYVYVEMNSITLENKTSDFLFYSYFIIAAIGLVLIFIRFIFDLIGYIYKGVMWVLIKLGLVQPKENNENDESNENKVRDEKKNKSFIIGLCQIAGFIANSGGAYDQNQKMLIAKFIDEAGDQYEQSFKEQLYDEFIHGQEIRNIKSICKKLREDYNEHELNTVFLNLLFALVYADEIATSLELKSLYTVTDALDLPRNIVDLKIKAYESLIKAKKNASFEKEKTFDDPLSKNYHSISSRQEALAVLELPIYATSDEIKKAYLKLIKEYHPDLLKAKGITGTLKDEYEFKTRLINEAYNFLKNS